MKNIKTTVSNPKEKLLLNVGLEDLHLESKEWLETITFWKDETIFFHNLLKKKEHPEHSVNFINFILEILDDIHAKLFNYLEDDIIAHEIILSKLELGEIRLADANYREKHYLLLKRMNLFQKDFHNYKKNVIDSLKDL